MKKHLKRLIKHIRYFLKKNKHDNIPALSAQSAFFIMLSFVPFLMFVFAIVSFFINPADFNYDGLKPFLTDDSLSMLKQIVEETIRRSSGVAVYTIVIALWSSAKGIYSITDGISRVYRLPDKHNWFVKRTFAMGYMLVMFVTILIAGIGVLGVSLIDSYIEPIIKQLPYSVYFVYLLRYLLFFVLLSLLLTLALKLYLFRKVSDKRFAKFRVLLPGMSFVALCWILLSFGVAVYSRYFAASSIYGSLSTLIIVMMWIYFGMYILLFGVQLNFIYRNAFYNFKLRNIIRKRKNK